MGVTPYQLMEIEFRKNKTDSVISFVILPQLIQIIWRILKNTGLVWFNSSAMQMYGKYMNFLAIKNKREIDTLHYR